MEETMKSPRVAVLAVGTELTYGQITNRNASWLSQELKRAGFRTDFHFTMRDDQVQILDFFRMTQDRADVVIVTGGLGPTSDDFTRVVIADFAEVPLEWNSESWELLTQRQRQLRLKTRENHKQQCFFPKGSKRLFNRAGTAEGFSLAVRGKDWFALPGPPAEVSAIFHDHVLPFLKEKYPQREFEITRKWQVLGRVESELAEILTTHLPPHPFEVGYRVHLPYVEVKLSYSSAQEQEAALIVKKIEHLIGSSTVLRDEESLWNRLSQAIQSYPSIAIDDKLSGAYLRKKWFENLNTPALIEKSYFVDSTLIIDDHSALIVELRSLSVGEAQVQVRWKGRRVLKNLKAPFYVAGLALRQTQILTEQALLFVAKQVTEWNP